MSEDPFIYFQKFHNLETAQALAAQLKDAGLEVALEDALAPVDITFSGPSKPQDWRVKVRQSAFEKANQVLEKQAAETIQQFQQDYHLFDFTTEELLEVVSQPHEWSKEDYLLAQQILREQGHDLSPARLAELKQKSIDDFRKPESANALGLFIGFLVIAMGGLFAVFIGHAYWKLKKTDPQGQRVYVYDEKTRKIGQLMFWLGLISFMFWSYIVFLMPLL